jgi:hypothetical protein
MSSRDSEHYEDSQDMIARIRKLREAAEKKMNAFGDPADYNVRLIRGRKSERETVTNANSEDSQ